MTWGRSVPVPPPPSVPTIALTTRSTGPEVQSQEGDSSDSVSPPELSHPVPGNATAPTLVIVLLLALPK